MRRLGALLLVFVAAARLPAQTLVGTIVRPDGSPAAYVVVTANANEEKNAGAVRTLTDARGRYRLALPTREARYRLRALQVGWQPTDGPVVGPFAAATDTLRVPAITMLGVPITLPAVRVRGTDVCGEKARDGAAVAAVWEQARTALLASTVRADPGADEGADGRASAPRMLGRDANDALRSEWIEYTRELDESGRRVRRQSQQAMRGATVRPFTSVPAESLAARGYVVDQPDGTEFRAPDADVLLSPSFAAAHCFRLEPPRDDTPEQIGVSFRPAHDVVGRADVSGVLWVEQRTGELRSLQFRYTNLPAAAEAASPGGEVAFLHLPTGEWVVRQWAIRMPLVDARTRPVNVSGRSLITRGSSRTLAGIQVAGGDVLRVSRGAESLYEGDGATLEVRLRATTNPIPRFRAELEGTDYAWSSDGRGIARLHPVLPGSYQLRVITSLMDSLGVTMPAIPIAVGEDGRIVEVPVPDDAALARAVCEDKGLESPAGTVFARGVVRDARGTPVPGAVLRVRVSRDSTARGGEARVILNDDAIRVRTDSAGTWQLCGVPRDTPLAVFAAAGSATRDTLWTAGATLSALDLVLAPRETATFALRVVDAKQQPLRDVVADVAPLDGEPFSLRTDAAGRTPPRTVPRGTIAVRLRRVGYEEGTITIELAPGMNDVPVLLDPNTSPVLDTVRVTAARERGGRHSDFDRRRLSAVASKVIDREEIERRAPVSTWQLLTRVPGLIVLDSLGYRYAKSTRERTLSCWMRVAIDGRLLSEPRPNLAMLPPPSEIYGIEVFSGPASIPPEFAVAGAAESADGLRSRNFCGVISIWTR